MLVVSDASPVNVLVRIHHVEVLPKVFRRVVIPPAVEGEMLHASTPKEAKQPFQSPAR